MGMLGCYPTLNIPNDTDVFPTNDMKQQVWNVLHCKYIPLTHISRLHCQLLCKSIFNFTMTLYMLLLGSGSLTIQIEPSN